MISLNSAFPSPETIETVNPIADEVYVLPASVAQQRFWFLDQLEPGNSSLNMPLALSLKGSLNILALEQAVNEMVSRHEILRTTFTTEDGKLVQVIAPELLVNLEMVDLSELAQAEREAQSLQIRINEAHVTFNLHRGPLFQAKLVRLTTNDHILLFTMHHIVCDGWSNGVLVRELGALYEAFAKGQASPLADLPIQYGDFAIWQQEWLESEGFEEQLAYWKRQLGNELPRLNLPTDFPRNRKRSSYGDIESILLPQGLARALKALSGREEVTPFMIYLAAFKVLLYRYTGQTAMLIGSPTANRIQSETEGLIGAFANTLMLKTDLSGEPTFNAILQRVKEVSLGAFSNQSLPFERLIEELKPAQGSSNQLFQVLFIFQTAFMQPVELDQLTISPMRSVSPGSIFELSLGVVERAEGVRLQMEYNTDLFEAETIKRMLGHLQSILQAVVVDSRVKISEVTLLTATERHLLLVERNQCAEEIPSQATVCQFVEAQSEIFPEKCAIGSEDENLSYQELMRRADEMAFYLETLGAKAGEQVGIRLDSPIEFVVALFGVLKAGCVAVPLDGDFVGLQRCRLVISNRYLSESLDEATLIDMNNINVKSGAPALPQLLQESAAAIVFGDDRQGQVISHRALLARALAIVKQAQLTSADSVLIPASLYCCSTLELALAAMISGAELLVVPIASSSFDLLRSTEQTPATVMALPAATFSRLCGAAAAPPSAEARPSAVRLVMVYGERVSSSALRKWFGQKSAPRLLIAWGTPEAGCAAALIEPTDNQALRIARPSPNTQIYILDDHLQPVPAGVTGELYVAGDLGASSRLDETKELTIAAIGKKACATDYAARYLKNGEIEIIGLRQTSPLSTELSKIEDALLEQSAVLESKVLVTDQHLTAYIALQDGEPLSESTLRALIEEKAKALTLPITFVTVSSLPLTASGQVDQTALPKAAAVNHTVAEPDNEMGDDIENALKEIWKESLGVKTVGLRDDFFELGGHSLAAAKLFDQINRELGVNLPLATMFKATTVEQMAKIIREVRPQEKWSSLVPIKPNGSKSPLFLAHAAGGNVYFYKDLADRLAADQPLYGLQPKGLDGMQKTHERIEDMAAHYIEEIKKVQPRGPYYFGGSSFGGLVVYEMAIQLCERGEAVALVALFDTYAPGYPKMLPGKSKFSIKLSQWGQRVEHHLETLRILEANQRWDYIVAKARKGRNQFRRTIKNTRKGLARGVLKKIGRPLPEALKETQNAIIVASRSYRPRPYSGKVTIFRADKQPSGIYPDPTLGWSELVKGGLTVHEVPGTHGSLVVEPRVRFLIEKLEHCLEKTELFEPAMAGD